VKQISLFSDGSALGNPGPGGFGVILRYKDTERIVRGGEAHTTNNRMELRGVIEGLKALKEPCDVLVVSDSTYVLKGMVEWLPNWIKKNFKGIKNPDLWKEYIDVSQKHNITTQWVKGHSDHSENERCDTIAKEEAQKYKDALA